MTILIVDDNPMALRLLATTLHAAGHANLLTAESARDAFDVLRLDDPRSANSSVDLILMDLDMPGPDGIDAIRRIRADERLSDVPIIILTARGEPETLESAFAAGAFDYITKPLQEREVAARVGSALRLKEELLQRTERQEALLDLTRTLEGINQELLNMARFDYLTKVSNRRYFDEMLEVEWRRATRESKPLSLISIDIDLFKAYNDAYGHPQGDECLRQVARTLRDSMHRPGDFVARFGGEEFAVLLPNTDGRGAWAVAERLRRTVCALKIPHAASTVSPYTTISLGVAWTVPDPGSSEAELIALADRALYQAKGQGRNRTVLLAEP